MHFDSYRPDIPRLDPVSDRIPPSCNSWWINMTGLLGLGAGLWVVVSIQPLQPTRDSLYFILAATALPLLLLEYLLRPSPLVRRMRDSAYPALFHPLRVARKLLALYAMLAVVAVGYWLLPEYGREFYRPFWSFLTPALPWLVALAIPYFAIIDALQQRPEDEYYQFGSWLTGGGGDRAAVAQLFMGWIIKGFFLPLMIVYLGRNLELLAGGTFTVATVLGSFRVFFDWAWTILITVDLAYVAVGYCATLRLIDSHIRSTEPTLLGWLVALVCYKPFSTAVLAAYAPYDADGYRWHDWLQGEGFLFVLWGCLILSLMSIYALASVAFGHRFSNLTHRGIITSGPYRFSKHPAYLTKNISWWLIAIPFIAVDGTALDALHACLLLVLVNIVYYYRAVTEERHLSRDPVYREYRDWIDRHGALAVLRRRLAGKSPGAAGRGRRSRR